MAKLAYLSLMWFNFASTLALVFGRWSSLSLTIPLHSHLLLQAWRRDRGSLLASAVLGLEPFAMMDTALSLNMGC
jgi:hypothetical protein